MDGFVPAVVATCHTNPNRTIEPKGLIGLTATENIGGMYNLDKQQQLEIKNKKHLLRVSKCFFCNRHIFSAIFYSNVKCILRFYRTGYDSFYR
jgi:hypothetical protein